MLNANVFMVGELSLQHRSLYLTKSQRENSKLSNKLHLDKKKALKDVLPISRRIVIIENIPTFSSFDLNAKIIFILCAIDVYKTVLMNVIMTV